MEKQTGRIIKLLGGFYYIDTGDGKLVECRARGVFRKENVSPCVGDIASVEMTAGGKGYIMGIAPRKNELLRPPLANLDQLVFVCSAADPAPNLIVLDSMIAICEKKGISPFIVFTKKDLADLEPFVKIYRQAGFPVAEVCGVTGEGTEQVEDALAGKISAFTGNSGAGKSTLLNAIAPRLCLETAQISEKLGRGRHTTRHVELYPLENGGWAADTPGFSAMDYQRFETIRKGELSDCFREFAPFQDKCRFTGCSHTAEKGCAVREALQEGKIAPSRYENYCFMYEKAKSIKEWERKEQ